MNIEEYKFKDADISFRSVDDISISLNLSLENNDGDYAYLILENRDVIALAKHFKLTVDDIKE